MREPGEPWKYKVKLSEQAVKITTPGIQQVRRFSGGGEFVADMIFDEELGAPAAPTIVDPGDLTRHKEIPAGTEHADLLVPIFRQGLRVYEPPPLTEVRKRTAEQLAGFHGGVKRFANPHRYPVGLERGLFDLKTHLILQARGLEPVEESR